MSTYTLTYFDCRGYGEVSRQMFALAGVPFTDVRHPMAEAEWEKIKPTIAHKLPFNKMPILEVDGRIIAQSHSIARFVARRFNFYGKDEYEEAEVNAIADQVKDYERETWPQFLVYFDFETGDKQKLYDEVLVPGFIRHFTFFKNILAKNGTGFLVGDKLTWADLLVAGHIEDVYTEWPKLVTDNFPELKAHQERIHAIPALKKWIETRPKTRV